MKKQALWIRVFVLALALAMLVPAFAACAGDKNNVQSTKEQAPVETGDSNVDENGFLLDNLPDDLDFGETVKMLGWDNYQFQYYLTEEKAQERGDVMADVIYKRGLTVEDRLGIEFEWNYVAGDWGAKDTFMKEVETSCQNVPYDGMICYNLLPSLIASKQHAANIYGAKYLDLESPWWPKEYTKEMLINNTIYGIPESNDYGLLYNMMAIFFNTEMLEARKMEDPYELVKNNEWTLAKFSEMIKDTHEDPSNTPSLPYEGDIYGFVNATNAKRDAWAYALGFRYSEVRDGELVSLLGEPGIETYIQTMTDFYASGDALREEENGHQNRLFVEERAYFYASGIFMTDSIQWAQKDFIYGVVPYPKLNQEQTRYYTHLSNTYDAWCVPFNVRNMDLTSAVMECMASESYRSVGPSYYDVKVKIRDASDEKLAPMYDLIRDSVTFDFVYLYSLAFATNPKDQVKACITKPTGTQWASRYASNKDTWQTAIDTIASYYQPQE